MQIMKMCGGEGQQRTAAPQLCNEGVLRCAIRRYQLLRDACLVCLSAAPLFLLLLRPRQAKLCVVLAPRTTLAVENSSPNINTRSRLYDAATRLDAHTVSARSWTREVPRHAEFLVARSFQRWVSAWVAVSVARFCSTAEKRGGPAIELGHKALPRLRMGLGLFQFRGEAAGARSGCRGKRRGPAMAPAARRVGARPLRRWLLTRSHACLVETAQTGTCGRAGGRTGGVQVARTLRSAS
eukprot:SAG11_NODE_1120_length_5789_cov_12.068190_1_plen_239_part_00